MNEAEKKFVNSIISKIKKYNIKISLKEILEYAIGRFTEVQYNDGGIESVDIGVEWKLCQMSPVYFIDKYAFIDFPGIGVIPFNLYYYQKNILHDTLEFNKLVFLKSRQVGISTLFSLYCLWRGNFNESEYIDIVSLKQLKAQHFVSKMDQTIKRLPEFLKTTIIKDNTQELSWENGSQIISESQSENAGRSDSLSMLILDEAAHYKSEKMIRGIVSAAQPTLSKTGGKLITISTPNRTSGSGSYYYEQVNTLELGLEEKDSKLITIDWWEMPDENVPGPKKGYNTVLNQYIKKDYYNNPKIKEEANKFFMPIAEDQWKNNPWLKKQHDDLGDIIYKQEILHSFVVSGNSVFNDDILNNVKFSIKDPTIENKLGPHKIRGLWVWKLPIPNHRYLISVDVSTGTGNDSASVQVIDAAEYEQVAEYKGMIPTKLLGRFVKVIAKYYNEGFIVIECNGIGEAVFNEVYYHDEDPYNNLFKQKKTKNNITRMTGWITDPKSRKLITNDFIDWFSVDELWNMLKVYSKRLYSELTTWIWDGNKAVHDSNCHDDAIMAFAIGIYNRDKAVNYGESFIINNEGEIIDFDKNRDVSNDDSEEFQEKFDLFFSEEEDDDDYKKRTGVTKEEFEWLVK